MKQLIGRFQRTSFTPRHHALLNTPARLPMGGGAGATSENVLINECMVQLQTTSLLGGGDGDPYSLGSMDSLDGMNMFEMMSDFDYFVEQNQMYSTTSLLMPDDEEVEGVSRLIGHSLDENAMEDFHHNHSFHRSVGRTARGGGSGGNNNNNNGGSGGSNNNNNGGSGGSNNNNNGGSGGNNTNNNGGSGGSNTNNNGGGIYSSGSKPIRPASASASTSFPAVMDNNNSNSYNSNNPNITPIYGGMKAGGVSIYDEAAIEAAVEIAMLMCINTDRYRADNLIKAIVTDNLSLLNTTAVAILSNQSSSSTSTSSSSLLNNNTSSHNPS